MGRTTRPLFPRTRRRLEALGQRLKLARLRRRMPLVEAAARVGVSRVTYRALETGDPRVSLAVLARALGVLGLEEGLDLIAGADDLGRKLEDMRLRKPRRTTRPSEDAVIR